MALDTVEVENSPARGFGVLRELLRAMRPKDWIKNVFVFAAIAFAKDSAGQPLWTQPAAVLTVCGAFVLFCMVASAIYLILELGQPFDGLMQVPSTPLRNALPPL